MFSPLLLLILSIVSAESSYPYPPFNGMGHHTRIENMVAPELINKRSFPRNDVVRCDVEFLETMNLEEIQRMLEELGKRTGVAPHMLLKKLSKRMRNKEELEELLMNSIDTPPLLERLSHPIIGRPPSVEIPPETSGVPYFLPPNELVNDGNNRDTEVVIVPVNPSLINRTPIGSKPEHKSRKETIIKESSNLSPFGDRFLNLKPPLGITVRVNSGDPLSPINMDISISLSPLMTVIEAIRQASNKYQSILGLNHETNAITFTHSTVVDCYMINSILDIVNKDNSGWKVAIINRDGQVVYDNFCIPTDALVKAGTMISLTYVPL